MKKWLCAALAVLLIGSMTSCQTMQAIGSEAYSVAPLGSDATAEEFAAAELLGETGNLAVAFGSTLETSYGDYAFTLLVQNKTQNVMQLSVGSVYVNDLQTSEFWFGEIEGGAIRRIEMELDDFEALGIEQATCIDIYLEAFDRETYRNIDVPESVRIYPLGEEAAERHERPKGTRADDIERNENFALTVLDVDPLNDWSYSLTVYAESFSEREIQLGMENVQIDGQVLNPYWSVRIAPGKAVLSEIMWMKDDLEALGIEEIGQIRFTLEVFDWVEGDLISQKNYIFEP